MLYAIVIVIILILDQGLKYWTTVNLAVGVGQAELIPGIIHLTNVHNVGAAFSILKNSRWFFVVVTAIFIVAVIVFLAKNKIRGKFGRWTLVLVLAGAIGNWIDRIIQGYVVDMFSFEFMNFAVFNIADIFITVGGILFCLYIIFHKEPTPKPAKAKPNTDARSADDTAGNSSGISQVFSVLKRKKEAPRNLSPSGRPRLITRPELEPNSIDPADPFAEWLGPRYDDGSLKPAARGASKPKAQPSTASEAKAAETAETIDFDNLQEDNSRPSAVTEFSLEDIMAEFRD